MRCLHTEASKWRKATSFDQACSVSRRRSSSRIIQVIAHARLLKELGNKDHFSSFRDSGPPCGVKAEELKAAPSVLRVSAERRAGARPARPQPKTLQNLGARRPGFRPSPGRREASCRRSTPCASRMNGTRTNSPSQAPYSKVTYTLFFIIQLTKGTQISKAARRRPGERARSRGALQEAAQATSETSDRHPFEDYIYLQAGAARRRSRQRSRQAVKQKASLATALLG